MSDCELHREIIETIREDLGEIKGGLKTLDEHIRGNGAPGLNTRVDRLEQAQKLLRFLAGSACVAAIGLIVKAFWGLL